MTTLLDPPPSLRRTTHPTTPPWSVRPPCTPAVVARDLSADVRVELSAAGVEPVWVLPRIDPRFSVPLGVAPEALAHALDGTPGARTAYLRSPNQVGVHADLPALVQVARSRGVRLCVDDRLATSPDPNGVDPAGLWSLRTMLSRIPGVHVLSAADLALPLDRISPQRIVLDVRGRGLSSDDLLQVLREHTVPAEASVLDSSRVVLCPRTGAVSVADNRRLVLAVAGAGAWCGAGRRRGTDPLAALPTPGPAVMSAAEVAAHGTQAVPLRAAIGRVGAEVVTISPPGLPLVLPGEVLTRETVAWLLESVACGARVGASDARLSTVRVARDTAADVDLRCGRG